MVARDFNKHVAEATAQSFPGVSSVKRGESDGEFAFSYNNPHLEQALDIRVLSLDVDSYPERSSFILFTTTTPEDESLINFIQTLSSRLKSSTVQHAITTISKKLDDLLQGDSNTSSDELSPGEKVSSSGFDDEEYYTIEVDDISESNALPSRPSRRKHSSSPRPEGFGRLKNALKACQDAGLSMGLYKGCGDIVENIFSVALRATSLGIPDEALEAWDLQPSDCIVLLVKVDKDYPLLADFIAPSGDPINSVHFCFGKCVSAKPSWSTARSAFIDPAHRENREEPTNVNDEVSGEFMTIPMSIAVNALLNKKLRHLLRYRRQFGMSWDSALAHHLECERTGIPVQGPALGASEQDQADGNNPVITWEVPARLQYDHALADAADFSIPLVAMQLGLRHLARCTHYCMVCHCKVQSGFEALKPYVCSDTLCVYQYLSLGIGNSVEHEIKKNPHVVDLLISFFYSALASSDMREFPQGLQLQTFYTGLLAQPAAHFVALADFETKLLFFETNELTSHNSLKENEWILVVPRASDPSPQEQIWKGGLQRHVCRVVYVGHKSYRFEICVSYGSASSVQPTREGTQPTHAQQPEVEVLVFRHSHDFDELEECDRTAALMYMAQMIPPVFQMRNQLLENPQQKLESWPGISKSALRLLRWIIASNRSYIVLDGHRAKKSAEAPGVADNIMGIRGLKGTWMKFQLAQGSPDKEQQFYKALESLRHRSTRLLPRAPTIFAWHGSSLGNWHSIIRTGLDFQKTVNGRSYGHGVYLSSQFSTSRGYASGTSQRGIANPPHPAWMNSHLKVSSAISICEILNCPQQFVSSTPHYVVDKIDWIQCRYLLVEVTPSNEALALQSSTLTRNQVEGSLEQDVGRALLGPSGNIVQIPLSALPTGRRLDRNTHGSTSSAREHMNLMQSNARSGSDNLAYHAEEDKGDDVGALMASDDELDDICHGKRHRSCSDYSKASSEPHCKMAAVGRGIMTPAQETPPVVPLVPVTKFYPGTLDHSSLPKLPEPTWQASSPAALKRLGHDIRALQQAQASCPNLQDQGWYIDFERITNVFHLIVELHSFDESLSLAQDMKKHNCDSIVMELRFGSGYPISPPFVRVIRPRFLPFALGGGGHVTAGGAICSELLTASGWSPVLSLEKVFLQVRLGLCETEPSARLEPLRRHAGGVPAPADYAIHEAVDAYRRAAARYGWSVPHDLNMYTGSWAA